MADQLQDAIALWTSIYTTFDFGIAGVTAATTPRVRSQICAKSLTNLRKVGVESTATIVDDVHIARADLRNIAANPQPDEPQPLWPS